MFSFRRWFAARMLAQAALDEAKNHNNRNNNLSRLFGSLFSQNGSQHLLNRHDTLLQFYYADEELTMISSELDTFDGRRDPSRCTNLVNQLRWVYVSFFLPCILVDYLYTCTIHVQYIYILS